VTTTGYVIAFSALLPVGGALAQSAHVTGQWTWTEVVANSITPVAVPNGVIEPGEAVRIHVAIAFTPEVGSPVQYHLPSPGGVAPVAGFASGEFSLHASGALGGNWSHFIRPSGFHGGNGGFDPGGSLIGTSISQFPSPPGPIPQTTNPILNAWTAVWTPPTYQARTVRFTVEAAPKGPSLFVALGPDPTGTPLFGYAHANRTYSPFVEFQVIPAPGAAVVGLGLGVLAMRRSR
jgi:hypothetical protein